jgi:uncharacterized protein (DUF433 family)
MYSYFMLDWSKCDAVERDRGKISGAWAFKGTRVPVKALSDSPETLRETRCKTAA